VAAPKAFLLGAVLVFASAAREAEFPRFVRLELIGTAGVFGNVIRNGHGFLLLDSQRRDIRSARVLR